MQNLASFFLKKGATLFAVFAITLLVILAALLFYQQEQATEVNKSLVVHTYEVTSHIQLFFNRLKDVELGERGYRITNDEKYLAPYYDALKDSLGTDAASDQLQQHHSVKEELTILRRLTQDNPMQQQNLDEMSTDVDALLSFWDAAIKKQMAPQDAKIAAADVEFRDEDQLVDHVHRLVNIMAAEENRLLKTRTSDSEVAEKKANIIISCGILLFYVSIVLSIVFYQRSRDKARSRLMHYTKELEMHKLALATSNHQKEAILASTAYILVTTYIDGTVSLMNREAEKVLGYTSSEMLGKQSVMIWHDPQDIEARAKQLSKELGSPVESGFDVFTKKVQMGFVEENEWILIRKDGTRFPVLLSVTEIRDDEEKITGFLHTIKDISDRKANERLKGEFISVVSHELRTPLTSIRGSLGLIVGVMAKDLPDSALQLVKIALSNSERLILLINDILDIDKMAAGQMRFDIQREPLGNLLRQAAESNRPYAEKFGVHIQVQDVSPTVAVDVDGSRFMQVLSNLISNAAKFSKRDDTIKIFMVSSQQKVRIFVKDSGVGIPPEFRDRIFSKFSQADSSATRVSGGTGLGLHITKHIVEQMGGQIGFETEVGSGTTFWIEFPETKTTEADIEKDLPIDIRDDHSRVLICEDDKDISLILKMQVELAGFGADAVYTIADARKKLKDNTYAAMTLDLMFPDENGLEFIRELRADPATSRLPIVVVSARAEDGKRTFNGDVFGVVDWLTKPLDEQKLISALRRAASSTDGTLPKVLHVEDDKDLSRMLAVALSSKAKLINAASIRAAKELLAAEEFSLIILDLGLPDGNGLALLESMGENARAQIPVLILSANEVPEKVQEVVSAAMVKSRMSETKIVETILSLIHHNIQNTGS